MKFTILTLFPESLESYLNSSIISKAISRGLVEVEIINFRKEKWQQVDDYAYGGNAGMVLKIEPIVEALREHNLLGTHIILLSASGIPLSQAKARNLSSQHRHITLICGHYEGVDARISKYISQEISIGDYLLTSGELASLVLVDCITRLVPGVINEQSLKTESFDDFLLDYPVYTRPREFEGQSVPEVYLNGNHQEIDKFRLKEQERMTRERRPDLWVQYVSYRQNKGN